MTQYVFGSGTLIGKRTDLANTQPALLGVLQEVEVNFDRTLKELMGQYNMPVAIAGAALKVSGKAKFGRFQMTQMNNLFFGQTQAAGLLEMMEAESRTVAAGTFTVAQSANFVEDLGVFLASSGLQYTPVAAGPTGAQYTVAAGVYTMNVSENTKVFLVYYSYNVVGSGLKTIMANQLQGSVPTFSISLKEQFSQFGSTPTLNLKLHACVAGKLAWPFKNQDFSINDLEFQAYADASGNWGTLSLTE